MTPPGTREGRACPDCLISRANAKAWGHRDWKTGVCGECAWTTWMPDTPISEDLMRAAALEMGLAGPAQPDLFTTQSKGNV